MVTTDGLTVGTERSVTYQVRERNVVRNLMPGVAEFARKPEVLATGWLIGLCEWPAMDALRDHLADTQCSLGTRVSIAHLAPAPPGTVLTSTARCQRVAGAFSEWAVEVRDRHGLVAAGEVGFVVVEFADFVHRRVLPKLAAS